MSKFKAVLFDLDGTLVQSSLELADALNDTMEEFNLPSVGEEETKSWIGHGTLHLLIMALAKTMNTTYESIQNNNKIDTYYDFFKKQYAKRVGTRSYLFDGAMDLLKNLKANNIKTAVITNKETAFTNIILDTHKLNDVLDVVVCGDTLEVKKPNPEGIFYILKKLNIDNIDDALFIGDSDTDIKAAQNAKMQCWAVPYGYNAGEPIQTSNPDKMIEKLSDINSIIE